MDIMKQWLAEAERSVVISFDFPVDTNFVFLCSSKGPAWHGTSGVHTHMTNTRITDPEILEIRYPMILNKFCLRDDNSGGKGFFEQN